MPQQNKHITENLTTYYIHTIQILTTEVKIAITYSVVSASDSEKTMTPAPQLPPLRTMARFLISRLVRALARTLCDSTERKNNKK